MCILVFFFTADCDSLYVHKKISKHFYFPPNYLNIKTSKCSILTLDFKTENTQWASPYVAVVTSQDGGAAQQQV